MRIVRPHLLPAYTALVVLACASLAWANSAPVVSNVTVSQRTDGSKKVDIRYDLADADNDPCIVSLLASSNGGATWTAKISALTGASGLGVTPGTGKLIVWDCKVDLPGTFGTQFKVRVCADDNYTPPPSMVLIPGGEFQMGDSLHEGYGIEVPVHSVTLDAFYIDSTEVTNQQYAVALNWAKTQGNLITVTSGAVYKHNSGISYPYCDTTTSSSYSLITWNGTNFGVTSGKGYHPMVHVSWYGAAAYANWRSAMQGKPLCYDLSTWTCNWGGGYRLPTEAEWEKAARGGTSGHRFPWSDSDYIQHVRANYNSSEGPYDNSPTRGLHPTFSTGGYPYTSPVAYFAANGYGLHDAAGNVCEWCNDSYDRLYYAVSPTNNPRGPLTAQSGRVLRGGRWSHGASFCRVSYRGSASPQMHDSTAGFRLALDAE